MVLDRIVKNANGLLIRSWRTLKDGSRQLRIVKTLTDGSGRLQTNIPENVKFLEISTIKRSPILVIFGFCDFQAWCFQKYFFIDFRKQLDHSFVVVIVGNFFTSFRVENNVLTDRAQKERTGIRSPCMNNLHDPDAKRPDGQKVAKISEISNCN